MNNNQNLIPEIIKGENSLPETIIIPAPVGYIKRDITYNDDNLIETIITSTILNGKAINQQIERFSYFKSTGDVMIYYMTIDEINVYEFKYKYDDNRNMIDYEDLKGNRCWVTYNESGTPISVRTYSNNNKKVNVAFEYDNENKRYKLNVTND